MKIFPEQWQVKKDLELFQCSEKEDRCYLQYQFFQMHEQLNIEYPTQTECLLNKESDTYSCQITLTNHTTDTLYFYITSTFGLFLKESTQVRHISPNTTIKLAFTIKSTNIISHYREYVALSISSSKLSQLCHLRQAQRVKVQLKFNENFVDDPVIEALVAEDAKNLLDDGYKDMWEGRFNIARNKFEECFQLIRKCEDEVYRMAYCSFALKQWGVCLRDIEAALTVHPENASYELLKMKALVACYGNCKSWQGEVIEDCFKVLKNMQLEKMGDLKAKERTQLKALIESIEQNPLVNRMRLLKKQVIAKALDKYSADHPISKWFSSKSQLNQQLKQILFSDQVQQNATPEQLIDPISYQIMWNPVILESGHSFEQKTLQQYFHKNGFKDPITRRDIYPQYIFHNINLRDFILMNPRLKLWRQYEYDMLQK